MPHLKDVVRHVRSKNAGPFWVTVDIFFHDRGSFSTYCASPALSVEMIAELFDVEPGTVKRFEIPSLNTIKISFPRNHPQGGVVERDMHSGQAYTRLLDLELTPNN